MRFPTPPNLTGMAGWEKQQMQERDIDQHIKTYVLECFQTHADMQLGRSYI